MRQTCLDMVFELAKTDPRVFYIGSDLGVGTLDEFKAEIPDRFFMEGISEANIIGMAAGLAMEGKIPYVNTIATFITRRCYEQVVLDLCLHDVPVRLIGNGGGLVYAPLGPTHEAIEDLALFRAIPNMTIVAPADADEMRRLMPQTLDYPGPIYIRLGKGYDPIVTTDDVPFEIGKVLPMREGNDALILTTGCRADTERVRDSGFRHPRAHRQTAGCGEYPLGMRQGPRGSNDRRTCRDRRFGDSGGGNHRRSQL